METRTQCFYLSMLYYNFKCNKQLFEQENAKIQIQLLFIQ